MSLPKITYDEAQRLVYKQAVTGGDRFRQWFYPGLPKDYTVNPKLKPEIERLMLRGYSAEEIAKIITDNNS